MAAQTAFVSPINAPSRGRRVQSGINDLKATIDGALVDGGRLMAEIILAGREAEVQPHVSQRVIERILDCLKTGAAMRSLAISTHHDLRKIMGQLDLQQVGWGDMGPTTGLADYETAGVS